MIKQYKIRLIPDRTEAISELTGYYLYGVLTELLDPDYIAILHSNSLSPISQYIQADFTDNTVVWTINLFNKNASDQISPIVENIDKFHINSCNCELTVSDLSMSVIQSDEALINRARMLSDITKPNIEFITSTSFKSNGDYMLFPSVEHIVRNLVNRWNSYSASYTINDEDAILALIQSVKIAGYRLQSSYYQMKGIKIPGFKGEVRFSTKMSVPITELFKILLYFSEYSGIGIKTSLGMGAAKIRFHE